MRNRRLLRLLSGMALLGCLATTSHAQWITQSFVIKPGWTAVYLNLDATYQSLDQLVGNDPQNPIAEVWLWKAPSSTVQYLTTPSNPLSSGSDWAQWSRSGLGAPSTFSALIPNAAYLVRSIATTNYTWKLKGKPVAPSYNWTVSGLNFVGFPTLPSNPPLFDQFLAPAPSLAGAAEIYQYPGGNLGPSNPSQIISYHATRVNRGQAYWVRAGSLFNDYFGPFQVSVGVGGEVALGDSVSQYSLYLHNTTASNVVVCAQLLPSETPPSGQSPIAGAPTLLVRGNLNSTNLTYGYTTLSTNGSVCWTLKPKGKPGADITVVLGVNRTLLSGGPGARYAGILRFTDGQNLSQVDVPVSAAAGATTGLWVGKALVSQVSNYLKTFQRDQENNVVISSNGTYIVTDINTNLGAVAQPFPMRLILHNDGTRVVLLQRVFYGQDAGSNLVIATQEKALDPRQLAAARRISAAAFPWSSTNKSWSVAGQFSPGGTLTATVAVPYDDQASNPFLHTYHPDHDNLDATFQNKLPRGSESYDIKRSIKLNINPPGDDFASLTSAGQSYFGTYLETITLAGLGTATRDYNVSGGFTLSRISPIATLTQP